MVFIIIVNWNGWRHTVRCLKSLKKLVYANFKVVVVDNGSTDESLKKLEPFTSWITLIKTEKNLGFGGGNNIGISYVLEHEAQYIWLLNNDTVVLENTLFELKNFMDKNPKVGVAGSVIYNMEDKEKLQTYGGCKLNTLRCYVLPCKIGETPDYITGASMFIRRQALVDTGCFDENFFMYWEDVDLNLRIKEKGWEIGIAESSVVYHNGGISTSSFAKEYFTFLSGVRFSYKHSKCFLFTLLVGFLFDRIVRKYPQMLIRSLISRKENPVN